MVNDARREGGVLRDKLQQTLAPLDVSELEQFDLFRTNVRTSPSPRGRRGKPAWPDLSSDGLDSSLSAVARAQRPSSASKSGISVAAPAAPAAHTAKRDPLNLSRPRNSKSTLARPGHRPPPEARPVPIVMAIDTGFTPCAAALDGLRRRFFPKRHRVGSYFVAS
jgi:hypothetical protein